MKNDEEVKRKAMKLNKNPSNKRFQLIIDYTEVILGKDYFSYS